MTFADWARLPADDAARELHRRVREFLSPGQRRATIATLRGEQELAAELAGAAGPLRGVPFFVKDLFDLSGHPTLAGSTFLPEVRPVTRTSSFVAACVERGATPAGKAHLHEFAYGVTGENPHYGDCEHPRFPGRTTGGSSSGSAALVAAGVVPLALGSDTGGSVRIPAAFCGLFGFRLTPGDAWISDAFPLSPTCDTAGWFTGNASDMQATHAALVGSLPAGRTPRGGYLAYGEIEPDVADACAHAAAPLADPIPAGLAGELRFRFAPASDAYHAFVATDAWRVHQPWAEARRDQYDPIVWQRLNRAHAVTPVQLAAAERVRQEIRLAWAESFRDYDFLLLPASPAPALTKADCTLANRGRIIGLTAPASLGGLAVLTLPVTLPGGLTTGLQVVLPDPRSAVVPWILGLRSGAG